MRRTALLLAVSLLAACAFAQQAERVPNLTVSGNGSTFAAPDMATVRLGVVANAPTAAEAQNTVNSIAQKLLDRLASLKISKNDIQTSSISISPIQSVPTPDGKPTRITGYYAQNSVSIRVTDLGLIGKVIDQGVAVGVNSVEGVSFGLRNDADATKAALQAAVRDARAKATAIAEALNLDIFMVLSVQEGGARFIPPQPLAFGRAMDMAQTPVMPGQMEVTASVTIQYQLVPKR